MFFKGRTGSLRLDNKRFIRIVQVILSEGRGITFVARGNSMWPFIKDGDRITVRPIDAPLRQGDVVLYRRADGRAVVHRVKRVTSEYVITRGDNSFIDDPPVPLADVLGRVVRVQRRRMFNLNSFLYGLLFRMLFRGYRRVKGLITDRMV